MNRKKRKKMLLIPVIFLLMALLFIGCTSEATAQENTVVIYIPSSDSSQQDGLEMVNRQLDSYVYEKLRIHVRLEMPANYSQTLNSDLLSGKQIDIAYCSILEGVQTLQKANTLSPLNTLLSDHGQGIQAAVDPSYFTSSDFDGTIYAIPTNHERHQIFGFEYNREIAERYGLDLSGIHKIQDLTEVFQTLHEAAPEIAPVVIVPNFIRFNNTDTLGDGNGVLTAESGTTVMNLYETQEFINLIMLLHEWQEQGYMVDYASQAGSILYYLRSGMVFGSLTVGKVGFETQETQLCGKDIGFLPLGEVYCPTDAHERAWYTIPTTSADPERAMKVMNLLYSDPYVANLIMYGIEGVHYEYVDEENRFVRIIQQGDTPKYAGIRGYMYCNQYICALREGYDADIWTQAEQATRNATKSPALGFIFDSAPVAEQVYRCDLVKEQYLSALYAGIGDPEIALKEFQAALKEAGIDEIITEKQRQLNAYLQRRQ